MQFIFLETKILKMKHFWEFSSIQITVYFYQKNQKKAKFNLLQILLKKI